jgi:FtsP/CotA-like multicopper oxidase with cupredoxin domain
LAYDEAGTLIAAYPATIGSSDTPSPSGTVQVDRIALNPGYTYNPKINFKQGQNDKVLTFTRPERSGRDCLDRAVEADLWHSRHPGTVQDRQDPKPWLRSPDQLGRDRACQNGQCRHDCRIHSIKGLNLQKPPLFGG